MMKTVTRLHSDLPVLPEKMKIRKSKKTNLYNRKNCFKYIVTLKQALNHGLLL